MKRRKQTVLVTMIAALSIALGGCSASAKSRDLASNEMISQEAASSDMSSMPEASPQTAEEAGMGSGAFSAEDIADMAEQGRKIIYEATLSMEAIDYDATCKALLQAVKDAGGNTASTDIRADSWEGATRYATYVLRIPAQEYSNFLQALGEAGNITSQQENSQDITAQYVDVEARLKSLKTQEQQLLTMLSEAGELETLLAIQNQLAEVQYQIESYMAQRNTYDDLVSYSTVTVYINEVGRITESRLTFGDRINSAFGESWYEFGQGCQRFAVGFVRAIPTLLVLAVIMTMIGFIWYKLGKRVFHKKGITPSKKSAEPSHVEEPKSASDKE